MLRSRACRHGAAVRLRDRLRPSRRHASGLSAATTQEEQTTQLNATTTLSGITFTDSAGDEDRGDQRAASRRRRSGRRRRPPPTAGGTSTNRPALTLSRLATGGRGQQVGLERTSSRRGTSRARSRRSTRIGTDTYACPTTGTRETDVLPCSGGHVRQVGTITFEVVHAQHPGRGGSRQPPPDRRPGDDTTAWIDRDARRGPTRTDCSTCTSTARWARPTRWVPDARHDRPDRDEHPRRRATRTTASGSSATRTGARHRRGEHGDEPVRVHLGRDLLLLQRRRLLEQGRDRLDARLARR